MKNDNFGSQRDVLRELHAEKNKPINEYGVLGMKWGATAGRAQKALAGIKDKIKKAKTYGGKEKLRYAKRFLKDVSKSTLKDYGQRMGPSPYGNIGTWMAKSAEQKMSNNYQDQRDVIKNMAEGGPGSGRRPGGGKGAASKSTRKSGLRSPFPKSVEKKYPAGFGGSTLGALTMIKDKQSSTKKK